MCSHNQASIHFLPKSRPWYPPTEENRHNLPVIAADIGDTKRERLPQLSTEGSPVPDKWGCNMQGTRVGGDAPFQPACRSITGNTNEIWHSWVFDTKTKTIYLKMRNNKEQQRKKVNVHNKSFKVMQVCQYTPFSLEKGRHTMEDL